MDAHDDFPESGLCILDLDSGDEHQLSDSKKYNSGLLLKPHIQWRGKSLWHIFCLEEAENQIIYGHNMKDGSMFADLKQYRSEAYFQNHRSIWIYRQGDWQQYVIFSCYTAREEEMGIYQSHFISEEEKQTYLKSVESKSLYTTGSQPEITDSLITLSTCLGKGKRVIVHAVLLCYTE